MAVQRFIQRFYLCHVFGVLMLIMFYSERIFTCMKPTVWSNLRCLIVGFSANNSL